MDPFVEFFSWLAREHGIRFTIVYDGFDRARFLRGVRTTFELSLVCIAASLVIGVVGAMLQRSSFAPARLLTQFYVQAFRNTPPLVQMYFFFFALGPALSAALDPGGGPILGSFAWAAVSLSLYAAAFNVEIFRAGIEATPRTTIEAAESLGFSPLRTFAHVIFPLALRVSLPALTNNLVNLVKTTTLAYAIAVPETLFVSNQIWSDSINVPEMMLTLLVFYNVIVGLLVALMTRWERRLRLPGYGR